LKIDPPVVIICYCTVACCAASQDPFSLDDCSYSAHGCFLQPLLLKINLINKIMEFCTN